MRGNWHILDPEFGQNLVTNPSFELATTGYGAIAGGTLLYTTPQPGQVYTLRVAVDAAVVLLSAIVLWQVRHQRHV